MGTMAGYSGTPMIIGARYNGPPGSANGGYTSGLVASFVEGGSATVTLHQPPPLATPLDVRRTGKTIQVYQDETLIAAAEPAEPVATAVPPVPLGTARAAATRYPGFTDHPFPTCYVCGPRRQPGDGLRIFPGPAGGGTAAPWLVPADVSAVTMWAALDCPGGWAIVTPGRPYVLGRMTATVEALPGPGAECVVVGQGLGAEGRKAFVRSTVYGPDGTPLARAEAIWIAV